MYPHDRVTTHLLCQTSEEKSTNLETVLSGRNERQPQSITDATSAVDHPTRPLPLFVADKLLAQQEEERVPQRSSYANLARIAQKAHERSTVSVSSVDPGGTSASAWTIDPLSRSPQGICVLDQGTRW